MSYAHTRFDISLFGIELTQEEELEMVKALEEWAHKRHPEQEVYGTALWAPGRKLAPIENATPIRLIGVPA